MSDPATACVSMSITLVKDQDTEGLTMEIMAIFVDAKIRTRRIPVDGRVIRLDFNNPEGFEEMEK